MITIENDIVTVQEADGTQTRHDIGSPEAFGVLSGLLLRSGWGAKYVYSFTWMGRPVIQLPDDMIRLQEVIYQVKPDVILEIGVAHGGSLIFSASLCKAMGRGRVIGVDIEIRPHNRKAIEAHELAGYITLIEGDSIAEETVARVRGLIQPGETVLVFLDGCHTKAHVLAELQCYGTVTTPGSYIVAMDGIMKDLAGTPRSQPDWTWNNPYEAAREFVAANPDFVIEQPPIPFNEGTVTQPHMTYWPGGFVKRLR